MLPGPSEVPQESRRRLLEVLASKGKARPALLGVSRAYFYQLRKGLRPIPDHILARLLELATDDDLALVPYFAQYIDFTRVKSWSLDHMINVILEWAKANPASARVLLSTLEAELAKLGLTGHVVRVTREHWSEWMSYIEVRLRDGTLSRKQAGDLRNYLRRLLDSTGWILSPGLVKKVVLEVARERPKAAAKMLEAARLFAREILQDKQLYETLPRYRPRMGGSEAPGWNEICRALEATRWPPAKAILILALSGLRIETLYAIPFDRVDLDSRVVAPMSDRHRKRDWFSFIPESGARYLREAYLPWREAWLERHGVNKNRFIPVKPRKLRENVYRVMDEVLGRRFQLRLIRHRVATQLSLYMGSLWVEILTGHAPHRIVQEHYLQPDVLEEMRRKYDEAMGKVPCL